MIRLRPPPRIRSRVHKRTSGDCTSRAGSPEERTQPRASSSQTGSGAAFGKVAAVAVPPVVQSMLFGTLPRSSNLHRHRCCTPHAYRRSWLLPAEREVNIELTRAPVASRLNGILPPRHRVIPPERTGDLRDGRNRQSPLVIDGSRGSGGTLYTGISQKLSPGALLAVVQRVHEVSCHVCLATDLGLLSGGEPRFRFHHYVHGGRSRNTVPVSPSRIRPPNQNLIGFPAREPVGKYCSGYCPHAGSGVAPGSRRSASQQTAANSVSRSGPIIVTPL